LGRLLGAPEVAWLVERVRRRLEDGQGSDAAPLAGRVILASPSHDQRVAATRLFGPPRGRGDRLTVDLALVERTLRDGPWPAGLADAVTALTGPVRVRGREAARAAAAWRIAAAALRPAWEAHPALRAWADEWAAGGGFKRVARAEARRLGLVVGDQAALAGVGLGLARNAARVLAALPVAGELRAVLAQRLLGDAHGLDPGRPLAAVVGPAACALTARAEPRPALEELGVYASGLASTVLGLGIAARARPDPEPAAAATQAMLSAARAAPLALSLTLDQVLTGVVAPLEAGGTVFVCENPSIIESAAAGLRARARARSRSRGPAGHVTRAGGATEAGGAASGAARACVVCLSGQPSAAATRLVSRVAAAGASVLYHGDFDWPGLRIASALSRHVNWTPWRFAAHDYEALAGRAADFPGRLRLSGHPAESPWDPELARAMARRGLAIEEEAAVELLVADVLAAW
jgi:uncharacterized protein (TIGR02679 family)